MDILQLEQLVRRAGEMAMGYFRHVTAERKADRSFVTVADREIETFLRMELARRYPQHSIIGEEAGWSSSTGQDEALWAIDPIDGTAAFIAGLPIWGVSVGLIEGGQPTAGAVYFPVIDEMYTVAPDVPARCNGRDLVLTDTVTFDQESVLFVTSVSHRRYHIDFIGKTKSLGSTAAHIVFVAGGRGVAALLGVPRIWDIAAAAAVLLRLGGRVIYLSGEEVDFRDLTAGQKPRAPLLVGPPLAVDALRQRITVRSSRSVQ